MMTMMTYASGETNDRDSGFVGNGEPMANRPAVRESSKIGARRRLSRTWSSSTLVWCWSTKWTIGIGVAAVSRRVHSGMSVSVSDLCDSPLMDVSPAKWNDWRLTSLSRKLRYVDESDLLTVTLSSSSFDLFGRPACFFSRCLEPLNTSMTTGTRGKTKRAAKKRARNPHTTNIQLQRIANRD
ncbi:hypothetical protein DAPPUDRAFT_120516 [Daphnia pulex]|uniref:Uncharacterized protein n=1 Tax=Daphnia pulex TaxID=6669 RepID=E9I1M1_DAPPU|nr:hypothetical protein DAPPUDRAFT_120516 [Daphnia pulex]|eukprot:EFX62109.1 hypothetical protein DAPPUDRAFT_120516 [Daphnia pulex]